MNGGMLHGVVVLCESGNRLVDQGSVKPCLQKDHTQNCLLKNKVWWQKVKTSQLPGFLISARLIILQKFNSIKYIICISYSLHFGRVYPNP